ncbi:MAG: flavin reductase family protein [Halioglobus sp.]|nr:flavin reductase family protein [Halioglobus sp.]MCB1707970.1 flavin reductase family protein [Halioglobus sp.]MCP5124037.1 flavin reductase family protein [Pseudomonadales bacterium]MCP5192134.1 flavin reductase family protein [Pseudomonadales bacterium]
MDIDSRELRNALGRFATGICIISTVTDSGRPLGLTANSFASVSLDPPLVLWSLQNNSDVFAEFSTPQFFAINVLAKEHHGHSGRYAKKGDHLLDPEHFTPGKFGAPIVHGALVSFECELHATHDGGDHLIIVGRVRDMQRREDGEPLLFYSGNYHHLA